MSKNQGYVYAPYIPMNNTAKSATLPNMPKPLHYNSYGDKFTLWIDPRDTIKIRYSRVIDVEGRTSFYGWLDESVVAVNKIKEDYRIYEIKSRKLKLLSRKLNHLDDK